jgi:2-polyprenyl-6-methoxyphenol hydroxylase-like FAD-dependent oxidoreductase
MDNGINSPADANGGSVPNVIPVIIAGAGPVGCLLALRLAQSHIRSVILEKEAELNQAPRAIGYYGPVHDVFQEIGIYDRVVAECMPAGGYVWRKLPVDDGSGQGGKTLGPVLGKNVMSTPDAHGNFEKGRFTMQLAQSRLTEILLEEASKTGLVDVLWNHEVTSLSQDCDGVTVTVMTPSVDAKSFRGQYLAGCDGGKSTVRKLLGVRLSGHSWPERFIATDVMRTAPVVSEMSVHFTVDPRYWGVVTPLEPVTAGQRGMWRYSMAVPELPDDDSGQIQTPLTDEQVLEPAYVDSLLLRQLDGPRPSDHEVVRKSLYKMHQLLASTMYRDRCFLVGDAAHINNPIGGLGLCTGLLDADALYQTLEIAFCFMNRSAESSNPSHPAPEVPNQNPTLSIDANGLFARYSSERRRIFQTVIHPYSSANKVRLHGANPDETARDDWYFQALQRGEKKALDEIHRPLFENWRTNMWSFFSAELKRD